MHRDPASLSGGTTVLLRIRGTAPVQPHCDRKIPTRPPQNQRSFDHNEVAAFLAACPKKSQTQARCCQRFGWSSVKHQRAGEGEAVKGPWNKWPCAWKAVSVYAAKALYCFSFEGYLCCNRWSSFPAETFIVRGRAKGASGKSRGK